MQQKFIVCIFNCNKRFLTKNLIHDILDKFSKLSSMSWVQFLVKKLLLHFSNQIFTSFAFFLKYLKTVWQFKLKMSEKFNKKKYWSGWICDKNDEHKKILQIKKKRFSWWVFWVCIEIKIKHIKNWFSFPYDYPLRYMPFPYHTVELFLT